MSDHNRTYTCGGIRFSDCLTETAKPSSEQETHAHHDEMEIYWFLEGDLFFAFEGERIPVTPGDMIVISSGQLHRPILQSTCRYYRKRVLFGWELISEYCPSGKTLYYRIAAGRIFHLRREAVAAAGLDALFLQLAREGEDASPYGQFCAMTTLCYFLKTAVAAAPVRRDDGVPIPGGRAGALLKYIDENLSGELCYQTLAAQAHVSVKSLYQFFKQETGFTLGKYIKERRIIKAKSLLNAGLPATEAALASGFKDYSVFYRNFRRETGMTPAEYIRARVQSPRDMH